MTEARQLKVRVVSLEPHHQRLLRAQRRFEREAARIQRGQAKLERELGKQLLGAVGDVLDEEFLAGIVVSSERCARDPEKRENVRKAGRRRLAKLAAAEAGRAGAK